MSEDLHRERRADDTRRSLTDVSAVGSPELARARARGRHRREGAAKCVGRRQGAAGRARRSLILVLWKWTRPITLFNTAWIKIRQKAGVKGRWHDNRHTLVTELAESGAGDEVIMSIAGHVSRAMLSRYSHVRMEAKRRALDEIAARQNAADEKRMGEAKRREQAAVVSQAEMVQ